MALIDRGVSVQPCEELDQNSELRLAQTTCDSTLSGLKAFKTFTNEAVGSDGRMHFESPAVCCARRSLDQAALC